MASFDSSYFYAAVSFALGVLMGFQAIYNRYPKEPVSSALTLPGFTYLAIRGLFPACVFIALYYHGSINTNLFLYALFIGVGAEAVLRSQILIKETAKESGKVDDLLKGPLDLLRWFQDLFLGSIESNRARKRKKFVRKNIPEGDFKSLCTRILDNKAAFQDQKPQLVNALAKLMTEFDSDIVEKNQKKKNERYRLQLGYLVLREVGESDFRTLFSDS